MAIDENNGSGNVNQSIPQGYRPNSPKYKGNKPFREYNPNYQQRFRSQNAGYHPAQPQQQLVQTTQNNAVSQPSTAVPEQFYQPQVKTVDLQFEKIVHSLIASGSYFGRDNPEEDMADVDTLMKVAKSISEKMKNA